MIVLQLLDVFSSLYAYVSFEDSMYTLIKTTDNHVIEEGSAERA